MIENPPIGATPLDPEEGAELLPDHIATQKELNEWEQRNILEAALWTLSARSPALDEATIRDLHRRMFDQTWGWAGRYRTSDKNLGVPWPSISEEVRNLVDDGRIWFQEGTYPPVEAVLRLHHRLVKTHPFPNGNGRHARLWADLLLGQHGYPPIEWRNGELDSDGSPRNAYISALRAADHNDYALLLELFGIR
jgi:Fic-DOC domain mobile mystery protein B